MLIGCIVVARCNKMLEVIYFDHLVSIAALAFPGSSKLNYKTNLNNVDGVWSVLLNYHYRCDYWNLERK